MSQWSVWIIHSMTVNNKATIGYLAFLTIAFVPLVCLSVSVSCSLGSTTHQITFVPSINVTALKQHIITAQSLV